MHLYTYIGNIWICIHMYFIQTQVVIYVYLLFILANNPKKSSFNSGTGHAFDDEFLAFASRVSGNLLYVYYMYMYLIICINVWVQCRLLKLSFWL
jgi:hypothetical protein